MKLRTGTELVEAQKVKLPESLLNKIKSARGADFEIDGWSCKAFTYPDGTLYRVKFKQGITEDVTDEFWIEVDESTGSILEIRYEQKGENVTLDNQGGEFQGYKGRKSIRFPKKISGHYSQAGELKVMPETGLRKPNTIFDIDASPIGFEEGHNTTGSYLYIHLGFSDNGMLEPRGYSAGRLVEENFSIIFQSTLHAVDEQKVGGIIAQDEKKIPILVRYGLRYVEVSVAGRIIGSYNIEDVIPDSLAKILEIQIPKSASIATQSVLLSTGGRVEAIKPS